MESALWALNLICLAYMCFWAIKQDDQEDKKQEKPVKGKRK